MSQLTNPYGSEYFTPTFRPSFKYTSNTSVASATPGPSSARVTPAPNNVQPWLDHISDLSSPSSSVKSFVNHYYGGTSQSYSFWMTWVAPLQLEGHLDQEYYSHHLCLIDFVKDTTSIVITSEMLHRLNENILIWHEDYEHLYYRYEAARLPTVPLTIHALVHTASNIIYTGPSDVMWEWVSEQKMGVVARIVKSRRFPFAQISNTVLQLEQLKTTQYLFNLSDEDMMIDGKWDWNVLLRGEIMEPDLSQTAVLRSPFEHAFRLSEEVKKALAQHFRMVLPRQLPVKTIVSKLPDTIFRAGKIRVLGEKESICSEWAASRESQDKCRDSSFVRLQLLVLTDIEGQLRDVSTCFYAQVHYVVKAILPADDILGIHEDYEALLAFVSICDTSGDATRSRVWYTRLKKPQFVNVGTIQCVVGRIKVGNRWGIIDTRLEASWTSFVDADDAAEEQDDS